MSSAKECIMSEPIKPGSVSFTETVKAKLPVFLLPILIIAIVYLVDNMLFWISSTGKYAEGQEASTASYTNLVEIILIVFCIFVPAVYFNIKRNNSNDSKVPTPNDAPARLRARANKPAQDAAEGSNSPKSKPLSEVLASADQQQQSPQSKQAANLTRWNQAINT